MRNVKGNCTKQVSHRDECHQDMVIEKMYVLSLYVVANVAAGCCHCVCCQGDQDLFDTVSGRQSTISSVGGRDPLHEELRYMHGDESFGGTLTPTPGGTMTDEYKYRSHTPSLYLPAVLH